MCSDNDCRIFRGTIIACDQCERNAKMASQMQPGMTESGPTPPNT